MRVRYLFGPNLGRLGTRDPDRYGTQTLEEIMADVAARAAELGHEVDWRQSDSEGDLVAWLNEASGEGVAAIVINPGALTHYSYAVRDAAESAGVPIVEVHQTNIYAREPFRRHSVIAPVVRASIAGAGAGGYRLALEALAWIAG
jgi:3-dehydroquinate dehydratase-2